MRMIRRTCRHCLLYFINPSRHSLKTLDIETLKRVHRKVNVVPVIAKADTLTKQELSRLKAQIKADLEREKIQIFWPGAEGTATNGAAAAAAAVAAADDAPPDASNAADATDASSAAAASTTTDLTESIPLAVIGPNVVVEVDGEAKRGRRYPWGMVDIDNEAHCDFEKLRQMLIKTHLHALKEQTVEHYERFRQEKLERASQIQVEEVSPLMDVGNITATDDSSVAATKLQQQARRNGGEIDGTLKGKSDDVSANRPRIYGKSAREGRGKGQAGGDLQFAVFSLHSLFWFCSFFFHLYWLSFMVSLGSRARTVALSCTQRHPALSKAP